MELDNSRKRLLAGLILGLLLSALAVLPICDLSFDCGCSWPGLGAYAHCDIHVAGPPDCPWCAQPWLVMATLVFSAVVGVVAAMAVATRCSVALIVLASLSGTVVGMLVAGVITALILGLPVLAGL